MEDGGSIKKPFGRIGGKKLLANEIVNLFPNDYENMTFVEPFFGGGSIYFKKEPSKKEIINDKDKDIYILLKGLKKYDGDKISKDINESPNTKEGFIRYKNKKTNNEYDKFIKTLYLFKTTFLGLGRSFNSRQNDLNYGNKYQERLKKTLIFNKDYKDIIKKYDSINTLFYFDPPYEKSESIYTHGIIDYEEMNDILNSIKGKFILSINYNKDFIKLFKNFKYKILKTKYIDSFHGGINNKEIKELIFMNYNNSSGGSISIPDEYEFTISKNKKKKYDVVVNGKKISFGSRDHQQFFDKIGAYSHLNHNDENRRRLFKSRFEKTRNVIMSPSWFSDQFLW